MIFSPPEKKGLIALDIDGTITAGFEELTPAVIAYFSELNETGWEFIFVSGRPMEWALRSLKGLPFRYAVGAQNGAIILEVPSKKILSIKYLKDDALDVMEPILQQHELDPVIYGGYSQAEQCFYRPHKHTPQQLDYLLRRTERLKEHWLPVDTFEHLPVSSFPAIKFFADEETAHLLSQGIEEQLHLHAPPIRDPFDRNYFVVQATHPEASKGGAVTAYRSILGLQGYVIAGGDDYNDISMFKVADLAIAMETAPDMVLRMAQIVAPPASKDGIVVGLKKAIAILQG